MSRLDLNKNLLKEIDERKSIVVEEKKKRNISIDIAKVVFVLDHSRSMSTLYTNGTVQRTLERIFPLAMQFDDNSEMEFYLFDTLFKELDTITTENIEDYTSEVIMKKRGVYGATNYAPIIEEITERYTKKEKSKTPTFVIFITDGNNADKRAAKEALLHAWSHAFDDRRKKKRVNRQLWQVKINASSRELGISYSKLTNQLKKKNININRKVLAELAANHPNVFEAIVKEASK